jgi:DNA polymerase
MLICLGSTAAKSLLGPAFRITQQRGQIMRTRWCDWTMATYHPSALLRIPDPAAAQQARRELTADLAMAVARLQSR